MDRGEAGGRGAELHYMDGGRKQMSEAGRFPFNTRLKGS